MEGLEKLEQVQRTIHLLHSVGISDANPDAERFLADFTFLLMQHCGELDITFKCQLISRNMSKISSLCIGGALQCGGEGSSHVEDAVQLHFDDKPNLDPVFYGDVAMVGMDAMMRSNSTIEDFCRSYFMFHNMEADQLQSIFRYLPMLSFTESYIYQLDGLNEKLLQLPRSRSELQIFAKDLEHDDSSFGSKSVRMLGRDPFRPLIIVLESHGLLTERIIEELRCGEEYWALERKLCRALVSNKENPKWFPAVRHLKHVASSSEGVTAGENIS